ncbi:MAG: efflux RND transporter periplasmic adaptor subunit [Alphaproteobacteria bacterium]|nr:efflux RND transporter periplasmic adaptor subunit [Alphaproteobacteria bacterium]MCB9792125.1 efflux RND transporter periplasmic adaptor subunit [Alphaproteobacteria bacterium]
MPTVLIGFILLLASCGRGAPPEAEVLPPRPVRVEALSAAPLHVELSASGVAEARAQVTVVSEATGRVLAWRVEVGQAVAEGEALLSLEAGRQRNAVAAAEATRDKAQAMLDDARAKQARAERLTDALSPADMESVALSVKLAAADLAAAEAQLAAQRRALADTSPRAPVAGVLSRRLVDPGQMIQAGAPVAGVVDAATLRVRIGLPPAQASALQVGDRAWIEGGGQRLEGALVERSLELDRATGTVPLEVQVPNPTLAMLPNTPVMVHLLPAEGREVLSVPQEAVLERFGEPVAFVVEGEVARLRRLATGASASGRVEVLSGLSEGEALVVVGAEALSDGVAVTVE